MSVRYVYEDECDWDEVSVTPEEIDRCQDVELMAEWHASMSGAADSIKAQLDAADYARSADEDWRVRAAAALSFHLMGVRRLEKRLLTFGVDVRPLKADFDRLNAKLNDGAEQRNRLKQRLFVAGRFAEAVKAEVGPVVYARLHAAVMAALDDENAAETPASVAA
jgi:hypothetical protein